jgi:LysM repeat protein
MATVNSLQTQDTALREQFTANPEAVETAQIDALLDNVQQTGKTTASIQEREQLVQILQYWAPLLEERTGEHPGTKLAAYDPDAEPVEEEIGVEETAVTPPEAAESTKDEPETTLTYIPGEPEDNQPQTLAQLFMTMPKAAKIIIFVLIALILAAIIFWILSPKTDDPVVDVTGTETAVAAAITASAQPTRTNTPTATPVIYIQSETAVAQSAPVGSPTPIIYIVQTGDTLNSVSRKYGIPVQDIAVLNNIYNANSIAVGQELLIPTPGLGTSIAPSLETTPAAVNDTPIPQVQADATNDTVLELVIRSSEGAELRIAAGSDYQAITTLPEGTFATIIAKTPDGIWYLIQLEDGFTRGWVPAEQTALLYPADPNTIPTTPMP